MWLPKIYNGRNRTFWFFSYEGLRQRQKTFDEDYVPTPAMFAGDFSQVIDNNKVQTHIYDPLTTNEQGLRTPFPADLVPQNRFNPFFGVMKSVTHTPTSAANPFQAPNLDLYYSNPNNTDTLTTKIDHRFSASDSLSGRFTRGRATNRLEGGRFGSPADGLINGFGTSATQYGANIAYFDLQILLDPIVASGDSGSVLVRESDNKVAGVLYAGDTTESVACPLFQAGYSGRFYRLAGQARFAQSVRSARLADDHGRLPRQQLGRRQS